MRAANMQALTDAVKRRHPGVVVYGIGDAAHMLRTSDHNEDDTSGSRAAQSDPDGNPEHRAIDIMIGAAFTKAQAHTLVAALVTDAGARARLFYIIFDSRIWSRSNGWAVRSFDGDPHTDHIHISGLASDDENAAGWPAVDGDDMATPIEIWTHDLQDGPGVEKAYKALLRGAKAAESAAGAANQATDVGKANAAALVELAGKVDALAAPDLDVLADKVADRLAAKLSLGFVPASPPAQG